jgi:hypothetical protein
MVAEMGGKSKVARGGAGRVVSLATARAGAGRARAMAAPPAPVPLKLDRVLARVYRAGWRIEAEPGAWLVERWRGRTGGHMLFVGAPLALIYVPEPWGGQDRLPRLLLAEEALLRLKIGDAPAVGYALADRLERLTSRFPTSGAILLVTIGDRLSALAA